MSAAIVLDNLPRILALADTGTPTLTRSTVPTTALTLRVNPFPPGFKRSRTMSQRGSTMSFGSSYYNRAGAPSRPQPRGGSGLGPRAATRRQAMRTGGYTSPATSGELKFRDVALQLPCAIALGTWTTPGPTTLLNGLVPDSTATGRIDRKVVMASLYVRATANMAGTSTNGGLVRMIVVYDKQANAQAPAVTDILASDSFFSPNNLSNRDRFVTLIDHVFDPIGTNTSIATSDVTFKKSINLETMFNPGTAGTIGDITSGSIYILAAQNGSVGVAGPNCQFYSRIRYAD